jgi:hypothetical protein
MRVTFGGFAAQAAFRRRANSGLLTTGHLTRRSLLLWHPLGSWHGATRCCAWVIYSLRIFRAEVSS